METINKRGLIELLSDKLEVTKVEAERIIEGGIEVIEEVLSEGGAISVSNFGKLEARVSPAREGRNPHTGESMTIEQKIRPKFTAGKRLKEITNKEIEI